MSPIAFHTDQKTNKFRKDAYQKYSFKKSLGDFPQSTRHNPT